MSICDFMWTLLSDFDLLVSDSEYLWMISCDWEWLWLNVSNCEWLWVIESNWETLWLIVLNCDCNRKGFWVEVSDWDWFDFFVYEWNRTIGSDIDSLW